LTTDGKRRSARSAKLSGAERAWAEEAAKVCSRKDVWDLSEDKKNGQKMKKIVKIAKSLEGRDRLAGIHFEYAVDALFMISLIVL